MRLDPVRVWKSDSVEKFLEFYMGKNTPERQDFIIDNLRIDEEFAADKELLPVVEEAE